MPSTIAEVDKLFAAGAEWATRARAAAEGSIAAHVATHGALLPHGANREPVSIATGQVLVAGEVLFATLTASATAGGGNVGNGVMTVQAVGVGALQGTYSATCTATRTNRGLFEVRDSLGYVLGRANVGTAYVSSVVSFTIADGSTDFAVGDTFSIVVTGSSSLKSYDFTASASPPQVARRCSAKTSTQLVG
jgi:hypothetical protein